MEIISAFAEEDILQESRATWWPNMGWVHCNNQGVCKSITEVGLHLFADTPAPAIIYTVSLGRLHITFGNDTYALYVTLGNHTYLLV